MRRIIVCGVMPVLAALLVLLLCSAPSMGADIAQTILQEMDLASPPHTYYERETRDRFARVRKEIDAGRVSLDRTTEKSFLLSLLDALEIAPSSQMLVFSTTSLQLSLISPANPRALYFNEDTYLGFVPGGRIEIVSIDPELGGIFYIFDIPKGGGALAVDRSRRCMNCHSGSESGHVPGLVIKSVVPGRRGGSLDAFRLDETGHTIPLEERFGGWYLTGKYALTNLWANSIGRAGPGEILTREPVLPGERFSFSRYPASTSDILPQLIHEHQAGFVNRVLQLGYAARILEHRNNGTLSVEDRNSLETKIREIVSYLLFAGEAQLPAGGIQGDAAFMSDFQQNRRADENGLSLKDFDLRTRLFVNRCSYMIYSPLLEGLPQTVRESLYNELALALGGKNSLGSHLPESERAAIRSILRATHPAFRNL